MCVDRFSLRSDWRATDRLRHFSTAVVAHADGGTQTRELTRSRASRHRQRPVWVVFGANWLLLLLLLAADDEDDDDGDDAKTDLDARAYALGIRPDAKLVLVRARRNGRAESTRADGLPATEQRENTHTRREIRCATGLGGEC